MKVYGMLMWTNEAAPARNGNRQVRRIVMAKNQKEAAALFRVSVHDLRNYGCETGNATEIAVASAKPGTVFYHDECGDKQWHELPVKP